MKNLFKPMAFGLLIVSFFVLLQSSCKKDPTNEDSDNGIIFNPTLTYGSVTDNEGNNYKTIVIGTQTWFAENLKTTFFSNGDPIPNISGVSDWNNLTSNAYCDYNNNSDNVKIYGRLYNYWAVADNRNICPVGWHVPTDNEITILIDFLGGDAIAGGKLKETGTTHWNTPNTGATNESGFTALPAGYRGFDGTFGSFGLSTGLKSSTSDGESNSWCRAVYYNSEGTSSRSSDHKNNAVSVRCIKD